MSTVTALVKHFSSRCRCRSRFRLRFRSYASVCKRVSGTRKRIKTTKRGQNMTPSKVIKIECGVCRRKQGLCTSKHCDLKGTGRTLERIEKHCRNCAPDHRVEDCTGQIIGTQAEALHSLYQIPLVDGKAECPLYPFQYGKNPYRKKSIP